MKLLCIKESQDKYTKKIYKKDEAYEFEEARAKQVLASGYFEEIYEFEEAQTELSAVEEAESEEVQEEKTLVEMTKDELKAIAETLEIKFNSRTTQKELVNLIEEAQAEAELSTVFAEQE